MSSTTERTHDKRFHLSWSRKTTPLKKSALFSKAKHSQEWHQCIEATAGILHPSDAQYPYGFLRNHTDVYLQKKGKLSQADTDIRLAILVENHGAKDVAVAAASHAITAKSLRSLLLADLNVAYGSYWGLETWLQCLIAANEGNPASVTDMEASWARMLLPYATYGSEAAGLFLKGMCRALQKSSIPSLDVVPEFAMLSRRATSDFSTYLEGLRLKCQWAEAHKAVFWMTELQTFSTPFLENLLLEHLFDTLFPVWRIWAAWRPDVNRITRLASMGPSKLATILDLVSLEGPDMITGLASTSREGLIAQYEPSRSWVQYRRLVIEVPDRVGTSLQGTLERVRKDVDIICTAGPRNDGLFELFGHLTTTQPITETGLDLFTAVVELPRTTNDSIYGAVRNIWVDHESLGGSHILALQDILHILDNTQAMKLRKVLLRPWLIRGIERCIEDCQNAVRTQMERCLDWLPLALELHTFCTLVKESVYVFPLLGSYLKTLMVSWPAKEQMDTIAEIYSAAQRHRSKSYVINLPEEQARSYSIEDTSDITDFSNNSCHLLNKPDTPSHPLEGVIEDFWMRRFLQPGTVDDATQHTMTAILHVWASTAGYENNIEQRSLAIFVSKHTGNNNKLRDRCLFDVASGMRLQGGSAFIKALIKIMMLAEADLGGGIVALTELLATPQASILCWKDLLYMWLHQENKPTSVRGISFLEYTLQTMKAAEWVHFMFKLEILFIDRLDLEDVTVTAILRPQLMTWKSRLGRFIRPLSRLEDTRQSPHTVRSILTFSEGLNSNFVISILECLEGARGMPVELFIHKVVGKLSNGLKNSQEIAECAWNLLDATSETIAVCEKIWDAAHGFMELPNLPVSTGSMKCLTQPEKLSSEQISKGRGSIDDTMKRKCKVPISVAEVMVAGYLQDDGIQSGQKLAVESMSIVLNLKVFRDIIPPEKLLDATQFWEGIEAELVKEVERLEALAKALKKKDIKGTLLLMEQFGIPDESLLDEELKKLPAGVIEVVEKTGENEIEISFPLVAYTDLQRGAMGIPRTANALLLRLSVDSDACIIPEFCIHYDSDIILNRLNHPLLTCEQIFTMSVDAVNTYSQPIFSWQIGRVVHLQIQKGNVKIEGLHRAVKMMMGKTAHFCISCGLSHNATNTQLKRSIPCSTLSCAQLWYKLPLNVRVPEIKTDTFAVDLLLSSVYAAAMTGRPELLPGCPVGSDEDIKTIMNTLPTLAVMSHAVHLSTVLGKYHVLAPKLVSWTCLHFRGFITTATGVCKVPNLPAGTHQFVLANASPKLESTFLYRIPKSEPKTTILFHGTTLDRLPAILAQGLRIYSGTSLQRIGAAHGKGIYLAEEPMTSMTYSQMALSWPNSGLSNMRLLLGCEVAGKGKPVSPGIHLITDEQSVMVRYIFLFPNNAKMPIARHIVPAMSSGVSALRSGTT